MDFNIKIILDRVKSYYAIKYQDIATELGLNPDQLSSVRAGRRKIKPHEVDVLMRKFPMAFEPDHILTEEPIDEYKKSTLELLRSEVRVQARELDELRRRVTKLELKLE